LLPPKGKKGEEKVLDNGGEIGYTEQARPGRAAVFCAEEEGKKALTKRKRTGNIDNAPPEKGERKSLTRGSGSARMKEFAERRAVGSLRTEQWKTNKPKKRMSC
jgi:hypothetical protein